MRILKAALVIVCGASGWCQMQIQFPPNLPSGGVYTFFVNPTIAVPPTSMVWGASTAASNPCATTGSFNAGVYTAPVVTAVCNVVITAGVNGTQGAPLRASATVMVFPVSGNSAGPPGVSPTVAAEPQGGNCAAGGVKITDAAGAAAYVCNGAPGSSGPAATFIPKAGIIIDGPGASNAYQFSVDPSMVPLRVGVPTSATEPCYPLTPTSGGGSWALDNNYYYICVAPSTWRRIALSSWQ